MDYDFALITLKDSGASAGYMGMDYGNSGRKVTLNLTTAGYPVSSSFPLFSLYSLNPGSHRHRKMKNTPHTVTPILPGLGEGSDVFCIGEGRRTESERLVMARSCSDCRVRRAPFCLAEAG